VTRALPRLAVAAGLALVTACSGDDYLALLSGQASDTEVPDGCSVVGAYSAADLEDQCARLTGRVALCGEAIVTESYGCFHDEAGQLWFGSPGLDDALWRTVDWERCTEEELDLVQDFETCTGP
jgi:hypothetical protein